MSLLYVATLGTVNVVLSCFVHVVPRRYLWSAWSAWSASRRLRSMLSRRAGAACERISQWQLKEFKHLATTGRNWSEVLYIVLSKSAKVGPPSLHSLDASCFCVPEAVVSGQLYSRHPSFRLNKSSPRAASGRGNGSPGQDGQVFSVKKNNLPTLGVPGQQNRSGIEDRRLAEGRGNGLDTFHLLSLRWLRWCAKSCRLRTPWPPLREARWGEQQQVAFCLLAHGTEP